MYRVILFLMIVVMCGVSNAQPEGYNYDESRVPDYTLPDPLVTEDGTEVTNPRIWFEKRRKEIFKLFETQVYGKSPKQAPNLYFDILETDVNALNGTAIRKQIRAFFTEDNKDLHMDILIYLPKAAKKPVDTFVGLNFYGNHTIHPDPAIVLPTSWSRNSEEFGITDNKPTVKSRGVRASRWPVELIINRGYALATISYGDIDPDFDDGFQNGVHPLFYKQGQTTPADDEWGSIAAWAWGLSRAMDIFESDPRIGNVMVMGHSRLGKTSLWAGALDDRFAIVISNDSGCGGAALSRRRFGETVERINTSFPHWFCDNFNAYNNNEDALPVDQHMLIALIAPRPVYIASAAEDLWADPRGEFLSALHADPVYRLVGAQGLPVQKWPAIDKPVMGTIGYHVRTGGHDVKTYDWEQYLNFADMHLK